MLLLIPPALRTCFGVYVVPGGRLRIIIMRSLAGTLKLHSTDLEGVTLSFPIHDFFGAFSSYMAVGDMP